MSEFWKNLYRVAFAGKGSLACSQFTESWECDFWIAQLLNGRIVVQVRGLKPSVFRRLYRLLDRIDAFSIVGALKGGYKLEVTNIDLSWTTLSSPDNDCFEGYILYPGFAEVTHPEYVEKFYPKVTYEVTNLSLGKQRRINANLEGARITLDYLPKHNDILRYARGLKTARILSTIMIDFLEQPFLDEPRDLILNLCDLLTLAQRSYVHCVAWHWQDVDGITKRSRYQEPVFDHPPWPRPLVPAEVLATFIETTFGNYSKKWDIWKLPWAIDYYVQAMSLRHILAQSLGFFTALETLKCAFLTQPGKGELEYYVAKGQFKKNKIVPEVLNVLSENFEEFRNVLLSDTPDEDDEKAVEKQTLESRVGELNRRAYKLVLKRMFGELNVMVDNEDLRLLVGVRNRIIHCGIPNYEVDPDMSEVTNWTLKFSSLVERTLLAILEYQGDFEQYDQSAIRD